MGSIGGRSALPFLGPYAASKHALEAFADVLRVELAPWGIAVSIVEPASVRTAIWTKGAAHAEALRAAIPPEAAGLYAERLTRFREVALKRGPGRRPGRRREGGRARADGGAPEGAVRRRAGTRTCAPGSSGCRRACATACSRKR